jgi:phosphatidylglycerol:prolipoprotein diacylglycerol transferase
MFFGAFFAFLLLTPYTLKIIGLPVKKNFFVLLIMMLIILGFCKIGCLTAGCCYGRKTLVSWSIVYIHSESIAPNNIPLHPVQLYEALIFWAIAIVGYSWLFKKEENLFLTIALVLIAKFLLSLFRF